MRRTIGVMLAISIAACSPGEPRKAEVDASSAAPATPDKPPEAKPEELNILRAVAMYDEFERQAIDARKSKLGRLQRSFPGASCVDSLVLRIFRERASDISELEEAVRALNTSMPDGALDEDHKAYLGLIEKADSDTAFSAEQALIHGEMIGELQTFTAALPESPIRPWANRTIFKLKDRLNEINPDVCANQTTPRPN